MEDDEYMNDDVDVVDVVLCGVVVVDDVEFVTPASRSLFARCTETELSMYSVEAPYDLWPKCFRTMCVFDPGAAASTVAEVRRIV